MAKKQIEPCTKEEIDAILNQAAAEDYYYLLFYLAKTTGRRLGEYLKIKVADINFEDKTMKTLVLKRRQMIYKDALLNDNAIVLLKQYIARHNLKLEDYLFGARAKSSIQVAIKRYARLAGIKHNVCFHNFRHYFVTHFLKQGWSYDQVSKLTGHSTPATLLHYDHSVLADVRKQAEIDMRNI